jgi:hypothetical protein
LGEGGSGVEIGGVADDLIGQALGEAVAEERCDGGAGVLGCKFGDGAVEGVFGFVGEEVGGESDLRVSGVVCDPVPADVQDGWA